MAFPWKIPPPGVGHTLMQHLGYKCRGHSGQHCHMLLDMLSFSCEDARWWTDFTFVSFCLFSSFFLASFFFLQHKSSDNLTHPWEVHCFCRCWRHSLNSLTLTFTGQTPFCLMKPDQVSAAVGKTKVFWNRDAFLPEPIGIRQCYQVTWMYQCWGFSHCNFKLLLA